MKRIRSEKHLMSSIAFAVALALAVPAAIAQGSKPPNPGGGNKPPTGETATNNLSYPAVEIDTTTTPAVYFFSPSTNPVLGTDFSYGCNVEDTSGETKYPNTSCVSADGSTYYTAEQCAAPTSPVVNCRSQPIERIYWQKTTTNDWTADTAVASGSYPASFVDWSDSLESLSWWTTATIRVETTPFGDVSPTLTGLTMWHVIGQGQTELWGARASNEAVPVSYESTFAILHTANARLNIAKLTTPIACPTAGPVVGAYPGGAFSFNPATNRFEWSGALLTLRDEVYTAELNIGGKYVYGYNWKLRSDVVPTSIGKAGWWRLTFYTPAGSGKGIVTFPAGNSTAKDPPNAVPPTKLYAPVVARDAASNFDLSYIDICVKDAKGGGGAKGSKGGE